MNIKSQHADDEWKKVGHVFKKQFGDEFEQEAWLKLWSRYRASLVPALQNEFRAKFGLVLWNDFKDQSTIDFINGSIHD